MDKVDELLDPLLHACEHQIDKNQNFKIISHPHVVISLLSVVFYVLWAIILVVCVFSYRVLQVLLFLKKPNEFAHNTPHGPVWYQRLHRAHLNTTENAPVFASLVICSVLLGVTSPLIAKLCVVSVIARVFQSISHIISEGPLFVNLRFTFFLTQILSMFWIAKEIFSHSTHLI